MIGRSLVAAYTVYIFPLPVKNVKTGWVMKKDIISLFLHPIPLHQINTPTNQFR